MFRRSVVSKYVLFCASLVFPCPVWHPPLCVCFRCVLRGCCALSPCFFAGLLCCLLLVGAVLAPAGVIAGRILIDGCWVAGMHELCVGVCSQQNNAFVEFLSVCICMNICRTWLVAMF